MEKKVIVIVLGLLWMGTASLCAEEPVKKESALKEITAIEGRGFLNFLTTPAEFVYTFKAEKQDHPKAWPATYIPKVFANMVTRVGSSARDILVLPWYARAAQDDSPLTRHFDMPDYVWQEE